jgi:hypothetical protein
MAQRYNHIEFKEKVRARAAARRRAGHAPDADDGD